MFLLGHSGAILMVTMLFMAVTSAGSAELVAVSSLFTYDLYKTYINPKATGAPPLLPSQSLVMQDVLVWHDISENTGKNATAAHTAWRCHVLHGTEYGGPALQARPLCA